MDVFCYKVVLIFFKFSRLVAAEEQYSLNQSKLLHLWFTKANEIKKQLRASELKGQTINGQSKEELTAIVQQLQVIAIIFLLLFF